MWGPIKHKFKGKCGAHKVRVLGLLRVLGAIGSPVREGTGPRSQSRDQSPGLQSPSQCFLWPDTC